MGVLEMFLIGGVGAAVSTAVVKLLENIILWTMTRKANKNDNNEKEKTEFEIRIMEDISNLKIGQKVVLKDRIKSLSSCYIREEKIDFDDRQELLEMYEVYHTNLGGNGNLDAVIKQILNLPLS